MAADARQRFLEALRTALVGGELVKLTLGAPTGSDPTLRQIRGRPVRLKAGPHLQLVWRHDTRDVTKNHPHEGAVAEVDALIGPHFAAAHLFTADHSLQLDRTRKGWRLSRGPGVDRPAGTRAHDRVKERAVDLDPSWMQALGVLDRAGKPKRGMEAKRRQILRFTEVLDHLLAKVHRPDDGRLRLVDMGCGKGHLTFAAWQLLRAHGFPEAQVHGVELRPHLVDAAEAVARKLGCEGLRFSAGTIADAPLEGADVVIALHACDTATDDALARGITAGARFLVVAPCCHQELRPDLQAPEGLEPVLHHGILRTRQAEIVTDALRAALLEAAGYRTRVFEFVGSEHTDKNLMITAVRRPAPVPGAEAHARALAATFGVVRQRLAAHLGVELPERSTAVARR